jgi:hypothetical protein
MTMLIQKAYLCAEIRHPTLALADAQQKAKSSIEELQAIANPRIRMSLDKLTEQVDGASIDQLVTIMRQAMAMMRLVGTVRPQVVADIYEKHWTRRDSPTE